MFNPNAPRVRAANSQFAETFGDSALEVAPKLSLAVVACMDSRMDVLRILGLANGDAHVVRNAGGVVTDDVIRSLCISQRMLGTREILLVHHTDCGLTKISEDDFKAQLVAEIGVKPQWAVESFSDPYDDVRQSIQRLQLSPFVQHKEHISGFVYDVTTGVLDEVSQ